MQDISNLNSIFGDVQALQSKLKSRLADAEQSADKFKAALQAAVKPETKAELVSTIKEKAADLGADTKATDLAAQIQATLTALREQLQAPPPAVPPTAASTVAAVTGASASSTAVASVSDATASSKTTAAASKPAATPPAAPTTNIAAVNPTHAAYRVYDPANPSAFVSPSNPGGGPNLLAADLVFNTDPRPDSVNSIKRPTAAQGSAEWGDQLKNYEVAYEKLSKENNDWNQKNMKMRNQTLAASPYAAFVTTTGAVNLAAQTDPFYQAMLADPTRAPA
ncbi:hypothetical protein UNDKW_5416 [Undibacterium sp. KW1]|uniref:hypothetical protein n=1 Tax=Undibacterium sp. KW1 TaxID=2058624 RepID=UPI001331E459|nr:hypothetical protein [Undibacterium sp. KW1]BBB63689.1 hypothetical protein UNDKW_5416 [Undibacterium sp. KW1]